jgi:uncharacterized lipoprotein YbaY
MITNRAAIMILALSCLTAATARSQEASPPNTAPKDNVRRAIHWKQFTYTCDGGAKVSVALSGSVAKVLYQDHQYLMKQTVSADGNRYSDGKIVWWGKGNGGFLQEDSPDGNGKMIVQGCNLDKAPDAGTGTVTGTVTYLQRMALPPDAVIEVKLRDVSLADAPAKTIADQKITLGNRQVPVPFELKFDPAKIDPKHSYSVRATILMEGQPRFVTDKAYPVITQGNPSHLELILKQVAADPNKP